MKKLGVFLLVFGASALFNRAELSSVDEGFIFNTTAALVEKHSWTMDEELSGRKLSRFSPLPSLFAAPFYAAADKFVEGPFAVGMAKKRDWLLFACGLSSCVLTAWTAVALVGLIRQLGYSESSAVWTSLLWAFGTLSFPYASSLFHQVVAMLLMVYVVRFAFAERALPTVIATALLISVQLTLAAAVLPLALRDAWKPHRRSLIGLSLGVFFGFGLHVLTNSLRGDHWLHGAYETETFTTPTFVGFVGLFFSSGKGLMFFAPLAFLGSLMLLPFANRRPEIGRPLFFAVACHCLVVIHWWAWHGSLSWGPRLVLPVLPMMMIPIADFLERRMELAAWQRRLIGSVAGVSIGVNVVSATQPMIGFLNSIPCDSMSDWMFGPSFAPLLNLQRDHLFQGRFESTGNPGAISIAIFVIGAAIVTWKQSRISNILTVAPWRSMVCTLIAFWLSIPEGMSYRMNLQQWNLEKDSGLLHFPIRGIYKLEFLGNYMGSISVSGTELSAGNRAIVIEAPPMSVPVAFNTTATLAWTVPGEGAYRVPIPQRQFSSTKRPFHSSIWSVLATYAWLLHCLAALFYFDWLLGGRNIDSHLAAGLPAVREDKAAD